MKKQLFGLVKKLLGFGRQPRVEDEKAPDESGARREIREPTRGAAPPREEVAPAPTFALAELARPLGLKLSTDAPFGVTRHEVTHPVDEALLDLDLQDVEDRERAWSALLAARLVIDTTLAANRLLDRAQAIEDAFDRERTDVRNAPRTLDVDLIVVGDRRSHEEHLQLPHPRAAERAFVLKPWFDLEPDASIPDFGPIADLLAATGVDGLTLREDLTLELE